VSEKAGLVYVRLICKLANVLDGIDVTDVRVGEVIDLSETGAAALIAEGWAEALSDPDRSRDSKSPNNHP
jgi:hypothetical protein